MLEPYERLLSVNIVQYVKDVVAAYEIVWLDTNAEKNTYSGVEPTTRYVDELIAYANEHNIPVKWDEEIDTTKSMENTLRFGK